MSAGPAARRTTTLTTRMVLLTTAVALLAAAVAIAVAVPLINGAARAQAQANLDTLAGVTVSALQDPRRVGALDRLEELLAAQQVSVSLIGPGRLTAPGLSASEQQAVLSGTSISALVAIADEDFFLSARPVGGGYGVVLFAPVDTAVEPAADGLRRLAVALLVGVAAASALGYAAAVRLTRPLRQSAAAARALGVGRRGLQVDETGPTEIADIAAALNQLSRALAASEGRQREFLLAVSHELRTPLTAVSGYAEALADGVIPAADSAATGTLIHGESARLERLVADLLDLGRLGAVEFRIAPVDLDLRDLVAAAGDVWRLRCEREHVDLQLSLPPQPAPVSSDPVRIRQIIDNLAENALRVTPAGGSIRLALRAEPGSAVVSVRDQGPGLTPDDRAVAFEPAALYTRYRGVRPVGTGMGLALVGRLAGRLGGSAYVVEAPGGGSEFGVRLPAG